VRKLSSRLPIASRFGVVLLAAVLGGCAATSGHKSLPADYMGWSIGYTAPPYMEVWIESIDVEDVNGRLFEHIGRGTASIAYSVDPAGWRPPRTLGGGRIIRGAALPQRLYVRWQSLVELQKDVGIRDRRRWHGQLESARKRAPLLGLLRQGMRTACAAAHRLIRGVRTQGQ